MLIQDLLCRRTEGTVTKLAHYLEVILCVSQVKVIFWEYKEIIEDRLLTFACVCRMDTMVRQQTDVTEAAF